MPDFEPQGSCSTRPGTYKKQFVDSSVLYKRALRSIAGGTTHDSRQLEPFPVYVDRAEGVYKWDISGHRLLDYWMGHGALLLGHGPPDVVEAIVRQTARGTHLGAGHEAEILWAELVCELVPSAEQTRFTSSGTEATMLALRIARAYTGRNLIVKLDGHFHGWHDEAMSHFVGEGIAGISRDAYTDVVLANPFSIQSVVEVLDSGDVAAVILEPGGGGSGALPYDCSFLESLRAYTNRYGALLIFDEVVSGFRVTPGGIQELAGVIPDLTTLGKILCGGLPGGAVVGRADVMAVFGVGLQLGERIARVPHTGTFNANPLSAVAGLAMLRLVSDGRPQMSAKLAAEQLARLINLAAGRVGVDVYVYTNETSIYHILIGAHAAGAELGPSAAAFTLYAAHSESYAMLRRALLLEGVDSHPVHGWVSALHGPEIIEGTARAFEMAFRRLDAALVF